MMNRKGHKNCDTSVAFSPDGKIEVQNHALVCLVNLAYLMTSECS